MLGETVTDIQAMSTSLSDISKLKHRLVVQSPVKRKSANMENMENKSAQGSSVLLFGLSFNLILTLSSLGFTCYSLNRFDSRLTSVELTIIGRG